MIPSDTRLALIDRATDLVGSHRISPTVLTAFVRHLRRCDLDVREWHLTDDFAASAGMTHYQARPALAQLVHTGLVERTAIQRRINRQDRRLIAYRLAPHDAQEGAGQ
ncbi:FaeA/PapI family transcriptional regulator [Streptomyces chrestomyceticus]|uniref:FaeA/PapI family transcriptional regulator n=1 Tax=Streptomyces chrestomyceticus TaxID=68185 RepID=UPI0033DC79AF